MEIQIRNSAQKMLKIHSFVSFLKNIKFISLITQLDLFFCEKNDEHPKF